MKFTAITKLEEWLLPNVSRASIMGMWGKVWLLWMSRGQTKYYTVVFKRRERKNSLWEKKKVLLLLQGIWRGNYFCWTQKIFSHLASQPLAHPISKTYCRHQTEIFPSNNTSVFSLALLSIQRPIVISKTNINSCSKSYLALQPTSHELLITATLLYGHKTPLKNGCKFSINSYLNCNLFNNK